MAFCRKCGRELGEGDRYCPDCGTPAGMAAGPTNDAPRRRVSPITILLIMTVAFLALAFFFNPFYAPADYEVTVTVEEFALCNTGRTVDNDPSDNVAEILFQFEYDGIKKFVPGPGETDCIPTEVGDPANPNWMKTGVKRLESDNSVSFKVHGSGTVRIGLYMFDWDGYSEGFGMQVHDTIDLFDDRAPGVERPGTSGLYFFIDLKPGKVALDPFVGDDLPMGYVKLSVDVKKL